MIAIRTLLCSLLLGPVALCATHSQGTQRFELQSVSVSPGQTWALNREIRFQFNEALDFTTVDLNTVRLTNGSGNPVVGSFILQAPDEMVFQPTCPTEDDLSDGGFVPGEVYLLHVPDATGSPSVLLAESGKKLAVGALVGFQTPNSNDLSVLFDDEAAGPPAILVQPGDSDGSYLATGSGDMEFFQLSGGVATLPGYLAPVNLHSDLSTRVTVNVRMNQTLSPLESNINSERIRLEYSDLAGSWHPIATDVALVQNCVSGGATLALTSRGIFPQGRTLRVWIGSGLQDIVGDPTLLDYDNLHFDTGAYTDASGNPIDHSDEWFEGFEVGGTQSGSLEDTSAEQTVPAAIWGNGQLRASYGFEGTGGPGGNFDFHVPVGTVMIIDTVSAVILGGPDGIPVNQQTVIGGVMDLRDLFVPATSKLLFSGPNPATIFASGTVTIDGHVSVDGFDASPVVTLNQPFLPQQGAPGNCGGGSGGVGSYVVNQVTSRGGHGEGAFGVPSGGGQGGETGWSASGLVTDRRGAGGGGGRFGHDQAAPWPAADCVDQWIYGLDAESGFTGSPNAFSASASLTGVIRQPPYGGHAGRSPFASTSSVLDDFYGKAVLGFASADPTLVVGELDQPWAGAGGGAGGDAYRIPDGQYPPATLVNSNSDKGAGGGGGAGSISVYALGDIVIGQAGQLTAIGGHGSAGENTAGLNRIGGGSGGGSGGHIVLHTAGLLDLSAVPAAFPAIDARGGEGGSGANNNGGADSAEQLQIRRDAKHTGVVPEDNPWLGPLSQVCVDYTNALVTGQTWVVRGAGGDGGPGVVQLHVANIAGPEATHSIAYPGNGLQEELELTVRPHPVGYESITLTWRDHLLPAIGKVSRAQSKWIALGQPQAAPGTSTPDLLNLFFAGTDTATGEVLKVGDQVAPLPAVLAPTNPLAAPGLPRFGSPTLVYFDPAGFSAADQRYLDNPSLLRGSRFEMNVPLGTWESDIASAELLMHGTIQVLAVTLEDAFTGALPGSSLAVVRPRSFGVSSNGNPNHVSHDATIRIEFQAAGADAEGQPDAAQVYPTADTWAADMALLTVHPANADFRYLRFRVTFELGQGPLDPDPTGGDLPLLDFLKLSFDF